MSSKSINPRPGNRKFSFRGMPGLRKTGMIIMGAAGAGGVLLFRSLRQTEPSAPESPASKPETPPVVAVGKPAYREVQQITTVEMSAPPPVVTPPGEAGETPASRKTAFAVEMEEREKRRKDLLQAALPPVYRNAVLTTRETAPPANRAFVEERDALFTEIDKVLAGLPEENSDARREAMARWESTNSARLKKHRQMAAALGEHSVDAYGLHLLQR